MIKFILPTMLFAFTLLSFTGNAYDQPQGIEVTGKAAVVAMPDLFSLSFAIINRGKSASKTKGSVDNKTEQVVNAAKSLGIKVENIQSARMNLRPIYQKSSLNYSEIEIREKLANGQRSRIHLTNNDGQAIEQKNIEQQNNVQIYFFEVSRQITIKLNNINDYDRLLDKIVKIGVTNISSLVMSVSKRDNFYQKALAQAIAIAKEKAQRIAGQAGVGLGKLIYLKEISYNAPTRMRMMSMASTSSVDHSSQVGQQQISAEVVATFAVKP
jgi:uncharacterized protein